MKILLSLFFLLPITSLSAFAGDFASGTLSDLEEQYSSNIEECLNQSNIPLTSIKQKPDLNLKQCNDAVLYLYLRSMHICTKETKSAFETELLKNRNNSDDILKETIDSHLMMIEDEKTMRMSAKNRFERIPQEQKNILLNAELADRPFNGVDAAKLYCRK